MRARSRTDFGGRQHGRHGGVLSFVVTHYRTALGQVHTGIPMTVTSTLNAPPGAAYTEGTPVADFTRPTEGSQHLDPVGQPAAVLAHKLSELVVVNDVVVSQGAPAFDR